MAEDIDIAEWDLIVTNGILLVGKRHADGPRIGPLFQLFQMHTPDGGVSMKLLPAFGCGLRSLKVPEGALRVNVSAFLGHERKWKELLEFAEHVDQQLRAQVAGL